MASEMTFGWASLTPLINARFHGMATREDSQYPCKTSDEDVSHLVTVLRTDRNLPPISMPDGVLIVHRTIAKSIEHLKGVAVFPFQLGLIDAIEDRCYFAPEIGRLAAAAKVVASDDFVEVRMAGYWRADLEVDPDVRMIIRWNLPPAEDIEKSKVNSKRLGEYKIFDFGGETLLLTNDLLEKWSGYLPEDAFHFRRVKMQRRKGSS